MTEEWRPFPLKEGYMVSNLGRIRGLNGKIRKNYLAPNGYYQCSILLDSGRRVVQTHEIIALTFCDHVLYSGLTVDHIDGNRLNNKSSNLRVIKAEDQPKNKKAIERLGSLNELMVSSIKERMNNGEPTRNIHKDYMHLIKSLRNMQYIKQERTWANVEPRIIK